MEFQAILEAVRALPVEQQTQLIDQIQDDWDSQARALNMSVDQVKEIRRRIAAYDADPRIGIPWEEFEAHIDKLVEELDE